LVISYELYIISKLIEIVLNLLIWNNFSIKMYHKVLAKTYF